MVNERAQPDSPLRGTRWVLESLVDGGAASPVPAGVTAWLSFGDDDLVTGNAGCNQFGGGPGGNYRADAATITFGDVVATMMSCGGDRDAVERAVLGMLHGTVGYQITGDVLTLSHPSGQGLRFKAVDQSR